MLRDRLIGALVGIARATDGNEHLITPEVTKLVMEGLAACSPESKADDRELEHLLERANHIKREMVPNCFLCDNPCGRTSDYTLSELKEAPAEVREMKLRMLALAQRAAGKPDAAPMLYDALYLLGMDMNSTEYLIPTMERLEKLLK